MGRERAQGYQAVFSGLRRRSAQADSTVEYLLELRDRLADAFAMEGNPLGSDQYGQELEKNRHKIENGVFGAFDAYVAEMEHLRDGLRDNARNYEGAEGVPQDG